MPFDSFGSFSGEPKTQPDQTSSRDEMQSTLKELSYDMDSDPLLALAPGDPQKQPEEKLSK